MNLEHVFETLVLSKFQFSRGGGVNLSRQRYQVLSKFKFLGERGILDQIPEVGKLGFLNTNLSHCSQYLLHRQSLTYYVCRDVSHIHTTNQSSVFRCNISCHICPSACYIQKWCRVQQCALWTFKWQKKQIAFELFELEENTC